MTAGLAERRLLALAAVLLVGASCGERAPRPADATANADTARTIAVDPHDICRDIRNSYECAQAVESQQLALSERVVRRGDTLVFTLADGSVTRVFDPPAAGNADVVHYTYWNHLAPVHAFVVHVQYYEGSEYLVIHDVSGVQEFLPGEPVLSPAQDRFAAASVDLIAGYARNLLQIWRVDADSFEREWQIEGDDWGPADVEWVDNATLNVTLLRTCPEDPEGCTDSAVLRRDAAGWSLDPARPSPMEE